MTIVNGQWMRKSSREDYGGLQLRAERETVVGLRGRNRSGPSKQGATVELSIVGK